MSGWPQEVLVYSIECIKQKDAYIGSTIQSPSVRWRDHLRLLNREKDNKSHHAPKLQYLWDKLGSSNFIFKELEKKICIDKKSRRSFEASWVEKFGTLNEMDVLKGACNFSHSEETKSKQRKWSTENNLMKDPKVKKKHLEAVNKPAYKALIIQRGQETRWLIPGAKEKWISQITKYWSCLENRTLQSKKLKANNAMHNPVHLKTHFKAVHTPEYKKHQKEGLARIRATPEYQENFKKGCEKLWNDPLRKARLLKKRNETRLKNKNLKALAQAKADVHACIEIVSNSGN